MGHFGKIVIFLIIADFIFFHMHYLAHHPKLYKHVHKKHHEWVYTTVAATIYATPFENIFVNLFSISAPFIVVGGNHYFAILWMCLATTQVHIGHCGHSIKFLTNSYRHDMHHYKGNVNFGSVGIFDYFYGTKLAESDEKNKLN